MASITPIIREDAATVAAEFGAAFAPLAGSTMLITGAAGFLCSYILDVVVALNKTVFERPCRVLALDNFATGVPDRVSHLQRNPNVAFLNHDITRPPDIRERIDWLIHGASIASPTFYRAHPLETIDANAGGTRVMLDLARASVRGMLQISSSEIYGDPEDSAVPTEETYLGRVSCTGPRACYDESKRLGETLAMTYHRMFGTPVNIARPFNVYGPGQRLDDARIIPDIISAAVEDRPIVLYSDGRATRAFCYVSDAVTAMLLLLVSRVSGEAFNVGNDEELHISEVAETMARIAGSPNVLVRYETSADPNYTTDNPQRRCPSLEKITHAIGWRPKIPLAAGLERTLSSYRSQALSAQSAPHG